MSRRWWVVAAVLSSFLLMSAMFWSQCGPVYQGRPLRAWLTDLDGPSMEARWRSAEAVRQMGTNAVPLLISQLSHPTPDPEPQWEQKIRAWLSQQSLIKIPSHRRCDRRGEALAALDALGPNAKAAVPALEKLLLEKQPDHRVLLVLASIGPEAVPTLTRALTNDEKVLRLGARSCLDLMRSRSEILFPKTPERADFTRRTCELNLIIMRGAFEEYRLQHPEQFLPDSDLPIPVAPLPLPPPEVLGTNGHDLRARTNRAALGR